MQKFSLAIHGGSGTILKSNITSAKEKQYESVLQTALAEGSRILKQGGTAISATELAVHVMEESELFNAGRGAVFTHEGTHEMEAAIMCGKTLNGGAVTGVSQVRNPISLARHILENSRHVMLSGKGAEVYARENGLELVDPDFFSTAFRRKQLEKAIKKGEIRLDHSVDDEEKLGTVGAVALDQEGHLAAATSTGGTTNKMYGRIGDTPIIGAGTYAEDGVCAVSGTGYGEYYIRSVAAYDIACRMKYQKMSLKEACHKLVHEIIPQLGGNGGAIAADSHGNIALPFNTPGMYRGWVTDKEDISVLIYK